MSLPRRKHPKQRVPNHILKALEDAREAATLERASFSFPSEHFTDEKGRFVNPTDYIKEKVRLHHDTWIIGRIDQAIAWAKGEV